MLIEAEYSNIIKALDIMLEKEEDVRMSKATELIGCSKEELFKAMYFKGGYTIAGALTSIATISKNKYL